MKFLTGLVCALFASLPAIAKELPSGQYALIGDVLPGIQQQEITPVYVHVEVTTAQLNWTFLPVIPPNADLCTQKGKCKWMVPALSHDVVWNDDGTLTVQAEQRHTGDDMTIVVPDAVPDRDGPFILDVVTNVVQGAHLVLNKDGGTLTNNGKQIRLLPARVEDMMTAVHLLRTFEQPITPLKQCGMRQAMEILNRSNGRSSQEQEVLDAARYAAFLDKMRAQADYYYLDTPPEKEAEIRHLETALLLAGMAISGSKEAVAQASLAGSALSDKDTLEMAYQRTDLLKQATGDKHDELVGQLLNDRRTEFLAFARLMARYDAQIQQGINPRDAICQDITFTQ